MKKFNFKIASCIATAIISVIFLFCSQYSKYCTLFACLFMAVCLVCFALYRQEQTNKTITATDRDLIEDPIEDVDELVEVEKLKSQIIKKTRRLNFAFYVCAFMLVVVGVIAIL